VATTDPEELPDKATWYLVTNLPHPEGSERANNSELEAVDLAEVVRLHGLRMWVEQNLHKNVNPQTVSGTSYRRAALPKGR
jgi:hypothetical protein